MSDCLFCKIIAGEIPSYKVYEDDNFLAFLDIAPVNPGHVLFLPKKHSETILDTDDEVLSQLLPIAKKIAKVVVDVTDADGFNLNQNNFSAAGQAVGHLHFHIVPRFEDDDLKLWPGQEYEDSDRPKELAQKMAAKLNPAL